MKLEELKSKELTRQRQLVQQAQDHEMREVEHAQKQQFLEFSSAWDRSPPFVCVRLCSLYTSALARFHSTQ